MLCSRISGCLVVLLTYETGMPKGVRMKFVFQLEFIRNQDVVIVSCNMLMHLFVFYPSCHIYWLDPKWGNFGHCR